MSAVAQSESLPAANSKRAPSVFVVDDDKSIRWVLDKALSRAGMQVHAFEDGLAALEKLRSGRTAPPDVVVTDVRMPTLDGFGLLEAMRAEFPHLPVIVMTAYSDLESTVSAYQGGAFEYLAKPFDVTDAISLVQRALALARETGTGAVLERESTAGAEIIGSAPAMQEVFRAIGRLSRSNITVLITGESGTGKELVARALHRHGPRAEQPFVALNTAAIPRDLLESELFGHERGAFTGAQAARVGRFEQADGGTLFLDEIGDMPAELQTRLLRVLADGEFYRVGGAEPQRVDVRIIAATHQDLERRVTEGTFREDLLHRLNVIRVHTPSLRDRREDIGVLLDHFLESAAAELETEPKVLHSEVREYLGSLDWPGNVRQLENACRWLTVMAAGSEVTMDDLPPELAAESSGQGSAREWEFALRRWADGQLRDGEKGILDTAVPSFERVMIDVALTHTGGRRQDAARLLGWGRNTLTRKIKELQMAGDTFDSTGDTTGTSTDTDDTAASHDR